MLESDLANKHIKTVDNKNNISYYRRAYLSPSKKINNLQDELIKHTQMADRSKIIQAIRDHKELQFVMLNPIISPKCSNLAIRDALRDEIIINDTPQSKMKYFNSLRLLSDLLHQTCINENIDTNPKQAYDTLVLRLSRRCLAENAFMIIENVLGTWNLSVLNYFDYTNMRKNQLDPIEVNVFSANSHIHATIYVAVRYGLIEKSSLNGKGEIGKQGYFTANQGTKKLAHKMNIKIKPWIKFNVLICERINLSTGKNVRYGKIILLE